MNREKIMNLIGLTLLAACFAMALTRVFSRTATHLGSDVVTIRFAHYQLESGVRGAFDAIAREYEKIHPGVVVEQMSIPENVYPTWTVTQLAGGTAPDLIEYGPSTGSDERLARYFQPLTEWVGSPNPYNKGTSLEKTPWRQTFLDGLTGWPNYNTNLLEIYGMPNTVVTIRFFYNRDLYRKITGNETLPRTYQEFIEVCRKVEQDGERITGHKVVPIAGSKSNAPRITESLFCGQVQKLWAQYQGDDLRQANGNEAVLRFAVLKHKLSLYDPAIQSAYQITHDAGQYMQPGFMQLNREDAVFTFTQGNALMIATGSYDTVSLTSQAPFEIGVFPVPSPTRDDPVYGKFVFGPATEAGAPTQGSFLLYMESKHKQQALDFLRFMTSQKMNALFAAKSGWLPAVIGVDVDEKMKPFMPEMDGYINGFRPYWGADTYRVIDNNQYLLLGSDGSVKKFLDALGKDFDAALVSDSQSVNKTSRNNLLRQDIALASYMQLSRQNAVPAAAKKVSELNEIETKLELDLDDGILEMNELGFPPMK